jgi:hypothetical protein
MKEYKLRKPPEFLISADEINARLEKFKELVYQLRDAEALVELLKQEVIQFGFKCQEDSIYHPDVVVVKKTALDTQKAKKILEAHEVDPATYTKTYTRVDGKSMRYRLEGLGVDLPLKESMYLQKVPKKP